MVIPFSTYSAVNMSRNPEKRTTMRNSKVMSERLQVKVNVRPTENICKTFIEFKI